MAKYESCVLSDPFESGIVRCSEEKDFVTEMYFAGLDSQTRN